MQPPSSEQSLSNASTMAFYRIKIFQQAQQQNSPVLTIPYTVEYCYYLPKPCSSGRSTTTSNHMDKMHATVLGNRIASQFYTHIRNEFWMWAFRYLTTTATMEQKREPVIFIVIAMIICKKIITNGLYDSLCCSSEEHAFSYIDNFSMFVCVPNPP